MVKMEIVLSSARWLTLIRELGKSSKESARVARDDSCGNGSAVTCLAELQPPLVTPTRLEDGRKMGKFALRWSDSLR